VLPVPLGIVDLADAVITEAAAESALEKVPRCEDVIVANIGSETGPIIGRISNSDIRRPSQA
jgi:hypothetical protein